MSERPMREPQEGVSIRKDSLREVNYLYGALSA